MAREVIELAAANSTYPFTVAIPRQHDSYESLIISAVPAAAIERVSIFRDGGTIFAISGRTLAIYAALIGDESRHGLTRLPIGCPLINVGNNLSVVIDSRFATARDVLTYLLCCHLTKDPAWLVDQYLRDESLAALFRLYSVGIYYPPEATKAMSWTPNYINQFIDDVAYIRPWDDRVNSTSRWHNNVRQIVFTFSREGSGDLLDILIGGELFLDMMLHTRFTREMAHTVDKFVNGAHIPTEPIYTITFGTEPAAAINISQNTLRVYIKPQPFAVLMHVTYIRHNIYTAAVGLRYTS